MSVPDLGVLGSESLNNSTLLQGLGASFIKGTPLEKSLLGVAVTGIGMALRGRTVSNTNQVIAGALLGIVSVVAFVAVKVFKVQGEKAKAKEEEVVSEQGEQSILSPRIVTEKTESKGIKKLAEDLGIVTKKVEAEKRSLNRSVEIMHKQMDNWEGTEQEVNRLKSILNTAVNDSKREACVDLMSIIQSAYADIKYIFEKCSSGTDEAWETLRKVDQMLIDKLLTYKSTYEELSAELDIIMKNKFSLFKAFMRKEDKRIDKQKELISNAWVSAGRIVAGMDRIITELKAYSASLNNLEVTAE